MVKTDPEKKAITLVELIIVLILLSILAAVAIARYNAVDSSKLISAAEKLASDFRYAQQYAITTGRWTKWDTTSTKANWYQLVWVTTTSTTSIQSPLDASKDFEVDFDDAPYTGVTFPYLGVSPKACQGSGTFEDNDLFFDSNGVPWCCTTALVCEKMDEPFDVPLSYSGDIVTVTVEPETGKVSVIP